MAKTKRTPQSTEQVMRALLKKHGHISLSLTIRMKTPATGQYGQLRGGSVNVQAPNVTDAERWAESLRKYGIKTAREMGFKLPGLVLVESL